MAQTKQEIRIAWTKNNMHTYKVYLHNEHNAELIRFLEEKREAGESVSKVLRDALESYYKQMR